MDLTDDECEEIARRASTESTLDDRPHADPRLLAAGYLRLRLRPKVGAHAHLHRDVIVFDPTDPPQTRAYLIAHECGHWLLRDEGWDLDRASEERAASRIAAALLLPRRAYLRDVKRTGWDLGELQALWPLASLWIHARRVAELAADGAIASRWSSRTCRERVIPSGLIAPAKVTPIEQQLARAALEGAPHEHGPRLRAWPVPGGAVVLVALEELAEPRRRRR